MCVIYLQYLHIPETCERYLLTLICPSCDINGTGATMFMFFDVGTQYTILANGLYVFCPHCAA